MNTIDSVPETTYPPRRPVRRYAPSAAVDKSAPERSTKPLRDAGPETGLMVEVHQILACAHPLRVHDGSETPSTINLKQVSTIAEMRTRMCWAALKLGEGFKVPA